MSKKEKLLQRLKSKPKDFTYNEAKTILNKFGFVEDNKEKHLVQELFLQMKMVKK